ncbi:MAG: argininosuccinate lyase [Halobacteriales archaeon]
MTGPDPNRSADPVVRGERFAGGPARGFVSSLADDRRIFEADLAVDRAHAVMLAEVGVIDDEIAVSILDALEAIEAAGYDALPEGEDVHEAIETAVVDRLGDDGGWLHTARSRNDEVATCLRWHLREDLLALAAAVVDLRATLLEAAATHAETLAPGYTHLQPAQPTTVGHWLASHEGPLARDVDRLLDAYDRSNESPLGAAAFAGTPFPIDRERTAELLGFEGVVDNAADAVSSRDVHLEAVAASTSTLVEASGLAADLVIFANRGFVDLDDDYASTSSIMPQKKNPDTLELVRATAGDAIGASAGLAATLKGLPRHYNRDLQRASRHVWAAMDVAIEAVGVLDGAVGTATWRSADLERAAESGFATATGVVDMLAEGGVPFRVAHRIVAEASRAVEDPRDPSAVRDALLDAAGANADAVAAAAADGALADRLDPWRNVEQRDSRGGPAPDALAASLERAAGRLEDDRAAIRSRRTALEAATDRLEDAVGALR